MSAPDYAEDPMKGLTRRLDRAVVAGGGTSIFAIKGWHLRTSATRNGDIYFPKGWARDTPVEPPDYIALGDR